MDGNTHVQQSSSLQLHKRIGVLVRQASDPHTPIWVSGFDYPVQYIVRQTRSMVSKPSDLILDSCHDNMEFIVSIPLIKLSSCPRGTPLLPSRPIRIPLLPSLVNIPQLDFFLPDRIFQKEKLKKLQTIEQSLSNNRPTQRRLITKDYSKNSTVNHSDNGIISIIYNGIISIIYNDLFSLYTVKYDKCLIMFYEPQLLSVNNNIGLSLLPAMTNTINGIVYVTNDALSFVKIFHQHKLLYTLDTTHHIEAIELLSISNIDETEQEMILCVASKNQWSFWIFTITIPPVLVFNEQYQSGNNQWATQCYWILHQINNNKQQQQQQQQQQQHCNNAIISFLSTDDSIKTVHTCKINLHWSVTTCSILPNSNNIRSIIGVKNGNELLLGYDGVNLILWSIVTECRISVIPLMCQLPIIMPLIIIGTTKHTVNNNLYVILCTNYAAGEGVVRRGVAYCMVKWNPCDTVCYNIINYRHDQSNSCTNIIDHCYHGDHFALLYSNNYLSCWSINKSDPVINKLIKSKAAVIPNKRTFVNCNDLTVY